MASLGFCAAAPEATASTAVAADCQVVAHRGDHVAHTENGMGAFRAAVRDGAEWLEADARVTSDQRVVLMHDRTVGRTTDGRGRVANKTARQIRRLHLNDGVYRPPFASQLLNLAARKGRKVLLELKAMGGPTSYARLAKAVRRAGVARVTVYSRHPALLQRIRSRLSGLRTAIASTRALSRRTVAAQGGIVVDQHAITRAWLSSVKGLPVYAYTVNHKVGWRRLSKRVDAIITDDPRGYIAARASLC
jgi:glycerophosphoryl diester phosphodiesterase